MESQSRRNGLVNRSVQLVDEPGPLAFDRCKALYSEFADLLRANRQEISHVWRETIGTLLAWE
jgi:hypothetical protein